MSWKLKSTGWNSKSRVEIHEVRVQIHELRVQIHELRVQIHESQVQIHELRAQIHAIRVQTHELQIQIHEFKNHWINEHSSQQSFKADKLNSFPKIISPKLLRRLGDSWGNPYVQFLVIISCFTFPILHGYGFSRKLSE